MRVGETDRSCPRRSSFLRKESLDRLAAKGIPSAVDVHLDCKGHTRCRTGAGVRGVHEGIEGAARPGVLASDGLRWAPIGHLPRTCCLCGASFNKRNGPEARRQSEPWLARFA